MVYIISKSTRREREERLTESRGGRRDVEGTVRRTEEAFEVERQRAREGKVFDKPYVVSGDSPEARQAETELLVRSGINPEGYRPNG